MKYGPIKRAAVYFDMGQKVSGSFTLKMFSKRMALMIVVGLLNGGMECHGSNDKFYSRKHGNCGLIQGNVYMDTGGFDSFQPFWPSVQLL